MQKLLSKFEIAVGELGYALGWLPKKEVAELTIQLEHNRNKKQKENKQCKPTLH